MSILGNEEILVELPNIEYLTGILGYNFIEGDKLTPEYGKHDTLSEVILNKKITVSLKKLNPFMNRTNLKRLIRIYDWLVYYNK